MGYERDKADPSARAPRSAGADTRSTLLRVAAELLEEREIEGVTLRAVGERAGVSRGAPYRHFADKEELLSVVATGYFERLGVEMAEAAGAAGDAPSSRLEAMCAAYLSFALEGTARYRLMFGPEMRASSHTGVHEAASTVYEQFVRAVAECQEVGELPGGDSPVDLAALLYAASHGTVDLFLAGHAEKEKSLDDPKRLVRLLLSYLRND